jgi:hypothetical protein
MTKEEWTKYLAEQQRMNKLQRPLRQEGAKIARSRKTKTMREQMDDLYKRMNGV